MARGGLAEDMLEGMASLVDKSLLRQEEQAAGETRFWMLQTLREFGLEQLARSGELEATRQAHAEYYLRLAEEAQPSLQATEQGRWLARLEQEHENLRAALFWLLAQARVGREQSKQQAEHALRLCIALCWFWSIRGYSREGQNFLEQALALRESVAVPVRASALYTAADLAFLLDNLERTEKLGSESLHLFRELGDKVGIADALFLLGTNAWARGRYTLARPQLEEAASLYQEMGENWKRAAASHNWPASARCRASMTRHRDSWSRACRSTVPWATKSDSDGCSTCRPACSFSQDAIALPLAA